MHTRIASRFMTMGTHSTHSSQTAFTMTNGISEIASLYDAFILDQYGVLHNGKSALPGAVDCVKELHAVMGKKLIILSNTSSPSASTFDRLPTLGFDKSNFVGVVTSGDEASKFIAETYGSSEKKKRGLWFTWEGKKKPDPLDFIKLCGEKVGPTGSVEEADFIILQGCQVLRGGPSDAKGDKIVEELSLGSYLNTGDFSIIDPILERCKIRGLPMICCNPDNIVVMSDGSIGHMPGKIAQRYESMGGKCTYFGKPHVPHFETCIRKLGLDRNRIAHVGDSLHHDVAGARAAGISSVFIVGGIHRDELGYTIGEMPDETALVNLFEAEKQTPTHVLPLFRI